MFFGRKLFCRGVRRVALRRGCSLLWVIRRPSRAVRVFVIPRARAARPHLRYPGADLFPGLYTGMYPGLNPGAISGAHSWPGPRTKPPKFSTVFHSFYYPVL